MKKYLLLLGAFLFFFLVLPVQAEEYELNTLIPVENSATIHTEKFDYNEFKFTTQADEKGNGKIVFTSIKNNTMSKSAVSINILLFDENKENVGYVTYCSDKDYTNEANRGIKLNGGEARGFTIDITPKFFAEKKGLKDIFYFAVENENKYCQIGGYDKYAGQTLAEIQGDHAPQKENPVFSYMESIVKNSPLMILIITCFVAFVIYMIICSLLNSLHYKMYGKKTILCFIPIFNDYIGVKLAFGKIIAIIFIIFYLIAGGLCGVGINLLYYIINGIWVIAFIVDIIKLITRNYDMLVFEPAMKNKYEDALDDDSNNVVPQKPIDLSYDNKDVSSDGVGEIDVSSGSNPVHENPEEKKEETDLTSLFR